MIMITVTMVTAMRADFLSLKADTAMVMMMGTDMVPKKKMATVMGKKMMVTDIHTMPKK